MGALDSESLEDAVGQDAAAVLDADARIALLEQQLADNKRRLENARRDFEALRHAISEDLREPLRTINNRVQTILEGIASRQDVEKIRLAANHLNELVDHILKMSTLSEVHREEIDLTQMTKEVAAETVLKSGNTFNQQIHDGMVAYADPAMVRIILECLIGNACMFAQKSQSPAFEVGMTLVGGKRGYWVRDNGQGFHPHIARRLFESFERLHADRDFPGCGMALATAKRLVERHGGRIWAQSVPGRGSTFSFILGEVNREPDAEE